MSRWWRAHDEAVDDPKLQQLPGDLFKAWFNLCCVTSQNGGKLPSIHNLAFKLHCSESKAKKIVDKLIAAGLVDDVDGQIAMHNWAFRQYKSDSSNERVQRYRERQRNVTRNGDVAPSETDIQRQKERGANGKGFEGKRGSPKHGAISPRRGTVFIREGTTDWTAYADDYRKTNGRDPIVNDDGGHWFKLAGAAPLPDPKRLTRDH